MVCRHNLHVTFVFVCICYVMMDYIMIIRIYLLQYYGTYQHCINDYMAVLFWHDMTRSSATVW